MTFNFHRTVGPWRFVEDATGAKLSGNTEVSNGETLKQLVLAGVGIGRLAAFHVVDDIAQGRLQVLLKEHDPGDIEEVHALWIGRDHLASRTRSFIDFLVETVSPKLREAEHLLN